MTKILRPLLDGLRLGLLAALCVLAAEVVYAHAFLPFDLHFDTGLVLLYVGIFTTAGLGAGVLGAILQPVGVGVPAAVLGAGLTALLLALRLHDLADTGPSVEIDGGLTLFGVSVAFCTALIASRVRDEAARRAAPTVLLAFFLPVLVFGAKLLVNTSPLALDRPVPVTLGLVATWPLLLALTYRFALVRWLQPSRLLAAAWIAPVVVTAFGMYASAPAPAAPASSAANRPADQEVPPIVWITVDTLRADHMSLYGYGIPTTPNLQDFATTATVYQNAVSQAPCTWQSVPSLLSGVTPYRHGGVSESHGVPRTLRLLPETLQQRGYRTVGQSANPWVSARYGMARGFEDFRLYNTDNELVVYDLMKLAMRVAPWQVFSVREYLPPYGDVPIGTLVDDAIRIVDADDGVRPLFLYIQPVDPHGPYQAPLRYVPAHGAGFTRRDYVSYWALKTGVAVTPRQRDGLLALYDGAITYTDAEVGRLFDELRERGLFDKALIVVTADHGEQFYDHGLWRHSNSLYQQLLHVPLIVKYPHQKVGVLVSDPVATIDIVPTLLRQIDQPCDSCEGRPLQEAGRDSTRPLFAYLMERDEPRPRMRSVVVDGWKLIRAQRDGVASEELYNLDMDPDEAHDQRPKYARIAADLGQMLDAYEAKAGPTLSADTIDLQPAERERLRALGYVQ
jgi:arylsulfatase A-like enzyme